MFTQLPMQGVYEGSPKRNTDQRGSVTKIFQRALYEELGIDCSYNETLISRNAQKGVIRGFHFQYPPYAQSKLFYCVSGACTIYLLDLRKGSTMYGKIEQITLSAEKGNIVIVPVGVANLYLTEQEQTTIVYQLTGQYMPEHEGGIRWDSVGLSFSADTPIVSERDRGLPARADFDSPFIWEETQKALEGML